MANSLSPWRIVLPVSVGTALSLVGDASLYAVLPTQTAVVGVALISVGVLLSANRWVRLIANNVAGWISDRYSKRIFFTASLFLGAGSTAIYAFTSGFWPLFAGRLLWGIAWAGIWIAGNGLVLQSIPANVRGRWIGRYHISFFLGGAMGFYSGGFLTDKLGYHQAMGMAAFISLVGALFSFLFLPGDVVPPNNRLDPPMPDQAINRSRQNSFQWAEVISATSVLGVNRIVIAGILASTLGLFLLEIVGETVQINGRVVGVATLTGLALGTTTLLSMIFTPLIGNISDKTKSRWQVVAGGLIPGMIGFGLMAFSLPFSVLLGLPLTSISGSSNQSLSTALMGDLAGGQRHGRLLGLLYTVGDLGSAIGPVLAFAILPILGISGLYWLNVVFFAGLFLVALYWTTVKGQYK